MRSSSRVLSFVSLILFSGSACFAATITGTVKGPDSAPFQGAFVEAHNAKTRMTFIVLSNSSGQYRIEKLPAGEYGVQIVATGYRAEPRAGVSLTADQNTSFDFALQTAAVRWNQIHFYQAKALWPEARGKELIFDRCSICHQFQSRMASVTRDADGWRDRVEYMRTAEHYALANLKDQDADDIATYLTKLFGPESILPKSPTDMPGYKATLHPFTSDAMNIVYVEYDMPGPSRMPFSAAPDKDGYLWIPNSGSVAKGTDHSSSVMRYVTPDTLILAIIGEKATRFPVAESSAAGVACLRGEGGRCGVDCGRRNRGASLASREAGSRRTSS